MNIYAYHCPTLTLAYLPTSSMAFIYSPRPVIHVSHSLPLVSYVEPTSWRQIGSLGGGCKLQATSPQSPRRTKLAPTPSTLSQGPGRRVTASTGTCARSRRSRLHRGAGEKREPWDPPQRQQHRQRLALPQPLLLRFPIFPVALALPLT